MTVREVAELTTRNTENFEIYKGNFLDAFYRSDREQKLAMISEEPENDDRLPLRVLPYLAGMVEKLCSDHGLDCPEWVFKSKYYLNRPNFWMDAKGELRIVLLVESPIEFKLRNIYTTANTLTRV